jgi:hypothetical protein
VERKKGESMKKLILTMALIMLMGCVKTVFLPDKEQPLSVVPKEWEKVVLKSVRGPDQTYIQSGGIAFQLGSSPASILKRTLQKRLKGKSGKIHLYVDNVRYAITTGSIGVGADFILKKENETKTISLEHTIDIPVGMIGEYEFNRKEILENALSRAVIDLTDIFLFNPEALEFIGGSPSEPKDSALLSDVDVGPVVALKPSSEERHATGRILWGNAETENNFMGTIMLGDMKGGLFYLYNRDGMKGVIPRYGVGLGGMSGGGFGAFMFNFLLGVELGYHGTMKTKSGYVNYPGFTAIVVPQVLYTGIIGSGGDVSTVANLFMFGGSFEVDIPIMKYFGLTGGVFAGTGVVAISVDGYSGSSDLGFIWYPMGDLYIQTSVGRFSVGMAFQQLVSSAENIGSVFDNPMITIKYEMRAGRGLAYTKSEIAAGKLGWTKEEVLSNPKNVFRDPKAMKIETPPPLEEE